jgi:UDP-N-acetylglucosamine 2-epimerase (non-hydrolysing)
MIKIANIVGARPNFMKIAPIHRRMLNHSLFEPVLIHTGQHYDENMSKTFFVDLKMPEPDIYLGIGSGSHATQTAAVMVALEKILIEQKPQLVVVVGDVNSTMAATIVASKLMIPVAHIEAGLRSYDRTMPEEINRIITDSIADYLFVTEQSGMDNLYKEGIEKEKIFFVGNVMIDSLVEHLPKAASLAVMQTLKCKANEYALMTLHRPSNVDDRATFLNILDSIAEIQKDIQIIFPIHPRTKKMIHQFGYDERIHEMNNLLFVDPMGYLDFLSLMSRARFVITDSGGIQEETTYLGIPCITLRQNTERPITIQMGSNRLVGTDPELIVSTAREAMNAYLRNHQIPPLWDGKASERIVSILTQILNQ